MTTNKKSSPNLQEIIELFRDDPNMPSGYYENFFNGIEIYGANVFILHYMVHENADYVLTRLNYENVNKDEFDKIQNVYTKAISNIQSLAKDGVPKIFENYIQRDLNNLKETMCVLLREQDLRSHKSITQMITCQAYLLFEYLKYVGEMRGYAPEDFRMDHKYTEIYKSIVKIFYRYYEKSFLPWPLTIDKVRYLIRNANKLDAKKLNKLKKDLDFYKSLPL